MAPWTVARSHKMWACHQRVPLCPLKVKLYTKLCLCWIGHCVMYAGPSAHPVLSCRTPCLPHFVIYHHRHHHYTWISLWYTNHIIVMLSDARLNHWFFTYQWIETLYLTWLTTLMSRLSPSRAYIVGPGYRPFTVTMGLVEQSRVTFFLTTCSLPIKSNNQTIKFLE